MTLRVVLAAAAILAAAPAFAQAPPQTRAGRPTRGLFGGTSATDTSQSLILNVSFGGVLDQDLTSSGRPVRKNGTATANLAYSLSRDFGRLSLGLGAGVNAHYYPIVSDQVFSSGRASAFGSFRITSKTTLSANQWLSYAPYRVGAFYPGGVGVQTGAPGQSGAPPAFDPAYAVNSGSYTQLGTNIDLRQQFTARSTVYVGYWRSQNNLPGSSNRQTLEAARAGFGYTLAKGLSLRLGYSADLRRNAASGQTRWRGRTIDAGIDFNRSLSISRRATLAFGSGATAVDDGATRRYLATGRATFNYELGRSWTATASYFRDVQYIDSFSDPLVGDSITAGVSGLLSRALQWQSSVGVRTGQFGIGTGAPDFRSVYASTGASYAISRYLALSATYNYFTYRTGAGALLPLGISQRMERQSIRLTLDTWLPVFVRTRRP